MRPVFRTTRGPIASLIAFAACAPDTATAHVKWFCTTVDVREMPRSLATVVSPVFLAVFALFATLVFFGFLLDGAARRRWPLLASCGTRFDAIEERVVRIAIGGYFLLLWDKGAVVPWEHGTRALLTPELDVVRPWIGTVQVIVALVTTTRFTCGLAALGILVLYADGIATFGLFHMVDYVFFPGIAGYLALRSTPRPRPCACACRSCRAASPSA